MIDAELIEEARKFLEMCQTMDNGDRSLALEDLRFRNGEHWTDDESRSRSLDGRPCLTVNNVPAIIRQVTNDVRQNEQSIHVHPSDSSATKEVAEIIEGLCRHIEYDSAASSAYDTALDYAASVGIDRERIADALDLDVLIERHRIAIFGDRAEIAEPDRGGIVERGVIGRRSRAVIFDMAA